MEDAEEFDIEDQPEAEEERRKRPLIKNAMDLQRLKLEKLMKNPDKQIIIPELPREKDFLHSVPTFVRNVMGSSAGAGSGEFHVYRHLRRKEYARQKYIQAKSIREQLDDDYRHKLEKNKLEAEAKTAKKRAKRLKKKQKMKQRGKKRKTDIENEKSNEEKSEDSESEDEKNDANEDSNIQIDQDIEGKSNGKNVDNNEDNLNQNSASSSEDNAENNKETQLEKDKQVEEEETTDREVNSADIREPSEGETANSSKIETKIPSNEDEERKVLKETLEQSTAEETTKETNLNVSKSSNNSD